ncbi:hypothetical protein [Flagellimonas sp.]|uniref:hypothetical protein n=1 Tax=Flagellimonas sp. TaxID=2058762 RepID=UPI003B59F477
MAIFLVPNFEQGMYISPLIFGFTIAIVNHKKLKINLIGGIALFVAFSYVFYFLSIYLTFGLAEIYSLVEDKMQLPVYDLTTGILLFVSGIITATILYLIYSLFLKEQNRKLGVLLILIISTLIPLTVFLASDDNKYTRNEDFAVYQISWLTFISLAFGIAINQMEIKTRKTKTQNGN